MPQRDLDELERALLKAFSVRRKELPFLEY
jgi:hypothetical protein